ncbi:MAG: twin-arginine translocase subunit TatC [Armatimonadetes bacterium]|nr:twin-arginine translocase subunit TatC [Armatimonadota bacterium]
MRRERRPRPDDEMDLMEHLDELRVRLFRIIVYVAVAGIIAWFFLYEPVLNALMTPLQKALKEHGIQGELVIKSITEAFFLKLKVSALLALALASPLILLELWGFIAPGLLPQERRPFKFVFPMAVALFIMGAGLSYAILPAALDWFLSYQPEGVMMLPSLSEYMLFVVKMCGAFGLGFELPVVLMFAGKIGLVNSVMMKRFWRQAVVIIMLAAAILTPSNDPFSMMMMAAPMAILYLGSIFLVKWVEPKVTVTPYGLEPDDEESAPEEEPPHPKPFDVDEED